METSQVNLRFPKGLIYDLEFVTQNLRVNKNEWLKVKLAELINEEKYRIMEIIEERYKRGIITEKEFQQQMGFKPPFELVTEKTRKELEENKKEYSKAAKKALIGALKETNSKKKET